MVQTGRNFEMGLATGIRKFPCLAKDARHGAPFCFSVFTFQPLNLGIFGTFGAVMAELVAYVDGGCLGNPGPSGIGVVISGCGSGPVRIAKWIGHQDNNVAEYAALMEALQYAVARKAQKLHVYSDSEVVVRQMTGEYTCRSQRLYSLHWTCRKLARSLTFSISHVRREENSEANGLAQAALRRRGSFAARV
jgi:ribonuclease HI